jgi:2-phospho-L-lactate/phosphoenolpyruvate guanylyltransferase
LPIWAIVPVKPFTSAKSRLASVLSAAERAGLSRGFLEHALSVLAQVSAIAQTLVVSRDAEALALARAQGALTVAETSAQGLNAALTLATLVAREAHAGAVLILPTDLPLLTPADVARLAAEDTGQPVVAIAPDRHEQGTNALLVRPPDGLPYAFGEGSFLRHVTLAKHAGLPVRVCRLPGAALDVDVPEDLKLYREET